MYSDEALLMLLADALIQAQMFLSPSETARLDAEVLLTLVLDKPREFFVAHGEYILNAYEQEFYQKLLCKRQRGEPIAYLLGYKEFWSLQFIVDSNVLIPRPETELLVEYILSLWPNDGQVKRIAELGVGSGAVSISIAKERPCWEIYATDISHGALCLAKRNSTRLLVDNIGFYQGSWYQALPSLKFNVIVSNPPYLSFTEWENNKNELSFEPKQALVANNNGLADIHHIISGAWQFLSPGGYLVIEHGMNHGSIVRSLLQDAGYSAIISYKDLQYIDRITVGRMQ